MAEWFAGQIMDKIINTCFAYLQDHFGSQTSMEKELQRLREKHPMIQAVLSASRQAQIRDRNPALNRWIWQLRDAIDEAGDLLDEFEYLEHQERLAGQNVEDTKVRSAITSFFSESAQKVRRVCSRAFKSDSNLKNRLEEVVQKLDKVSDEVATFLHLVQNTKQEQQICDDRASGSLPGLVFIGRDKEKEFVMQWLREPSNEHPTHIFGTTSLKNISLLSIVGHGGMGKTALLQEVFNDLEEEFDLKIWVCVSNNFKEEEVITDMLKYLNKWSTDLTKLPSLQEKLKSTMQSKKFLLVIDDIWEENTTKWEKVLSPMTKGKSGSKILVTTRMDSAASMISNVIRMKKETLRLKGLENDECLRLLKTHAFADVENLDDHKKLICIADEIVKKLSGSPLAAKVVGGVLKYDLTPEHWERVLRSNIGSVELVPGQNTNTIMPILRLSYAFLPEPLQNCFTFCSIFPQDHKFYKDDLVRMWIALSFIQPSSIAGESLEDTGGRYFDNLARRSFFDEFQYNKKIYYKMHDLLHELGQSISAEECFRFVENEELSPEIPKSIRHLFVKTTNIEVLRRIKEIKNLHSLILSCPRDDQDFIDVLEEVFKASTSIRLLLIRGSYQKMKHGAIENLIHLRYINFVEDERMTILPRSLCKLYHLQFIINLSIYAHTFCDESILTDMSNLSNLRYMKLPWNDLFGVPGIGKLSSLQVLNLYIVDDKNGYKIGELKHMNELRQLNIQFLRNLKYDEEACTAKLCEKRKLTNLSLNWNVDYAVCSFRQSRIYEMGIANSDLDLKVLENLKPYKNLKRLSIRAYMGARSVLWMCDANLTFNLEYISLNECLEWETLPPFGQLPFLKYLYLRNMPKAKRLDKKFNGNDSVCVFPSLEVLHIKELQVLEDWFDVAGAAEDDYFFPCLTELWLEGCSKLQELPYLSPKLKKVKIKNIGWKALNWKQVASNCCSISKSVSLETLEVCCCPNITSIALADARLEALRNLTIVTCPNLISLGGLRQVETAENFQLILSEVVINDPSLLLMEPLRSITSIKKLKIKDNDELASFSSGVEQFFLQVSSSLCELYFKSLKSLQSLPSSLECLSSLKILEVIDVPDLQLLPNIPASVKELELKNLKSLQYLPPLSTISSLKRLYLVNIPLLKSLPDLPPSLSGLWLNDLDQLECLPSSLAFLSSLQTIHIDKIPQLLELPDLPSSLIEMTIHNCPNIHPGLKECYKKYVGNPYLFPIFGRVKEVRPRWSEILHLDDNFF